MTGDLMSIAQFGFAAVMAYLLWCSYRDLIPRLMTIIGQNSQALANVASLMHQVVNGQRDAAGRIGRLDDRLLVLEERHKNAIRECPLRDDGAKADKVEQE